MKKSIYTERFSARITPAEKKIVQKMKNKMGTSDSEIFRKLLQLHEGTLTKIEPKEQYLYRRELATEIHKIGVNINQIAARVNTDVYLKSDKLVLISYLQQIKEMLKQILNAQ